MENLIYFLVLFPFLVACVQALTKNNTVRKIVTYISSAAIIGVAITFAVSYFAGGHTSLHYFDSNETLSEILEYVMIGGETFLMCLITVLSIKYKKYYAAALSIVQTLFIFWYELSGQEPEQLIRNVYIDQLTVIMVLIIAIVGTLITVYACGYMNDYHNHHTDVKDRRTYFFGLMYVFLGAMFGLVLSNNLIWLYFFWEITSVISFLLIGYTKTGEAIHNCFRALWMNLLGGCGIALAIFIAGTKFGITDLQSLIASDGAIVVVPVILFGFAALTKSAQFPFCKWLLGAMVAPTPSSALLHSATMVKAGVYLLLRLAPVLSGNVSGIMIAYVGGFTFLITSMLAITVTDGKKVLAYSTISNLGLITMCAGVGTQETVWAGMFLIIFHAVSKSLCFQTVGAIENTTGSRDIESMHGLVKRYPTLALVLCIGMAGMYLAPFGMLVAKWAALKSVIDAGHALLVIAVCFGSATTLVYWTKWMGTVLSSTPESKPCKNKTSADQLTSFAIHAICIVAIMFLFPLISSKVVMPYINNVFGSAREVISEGNIVIMIIMLSLIFIIPLVIYVGTKKHHYKRVDKYLNGVNSGDQISFTNSFGESREEALSNWYMEDVFGEKILWKPSIYISTLAIIVTIAIAFATGGIL